MNKQSVKDQLNGSTHAQWLIGILANTTFLTHGLQNGWISPMAKVLKSDQSPIGRPLTDVELSWVASSSTIAVVFTVSIFSIIVDKCGRKITFMIICTLQALCWIIKLCPLTPTSLIIARMLHGIGSGGAFSIVPMYVKEISQDNIRGTLGFLMVMAQNTGLLSVYTMGAYLEYYTLIWIALCVPVLGLVLIIFAPESPTYLVKIGKYDEAASAIAKLRGLEASSKEVLSEIDLIKREDDLFKSIPNISFLGIFKVKAWRRGFLIMAIIIIAHGSNGAFSILVYASTILRSSGVAISPDQQALSIPIFMILASVCSMFLVDRLGRKPILATTFILSALSFAGLASILLIQHSGGSVPGWLLVVAILVSMCCYAAGILPLPFVIMSEMFNFQIKAKLTGCIVTLAWSSSFIQLTIYSQIMHSFGSYVNFYLFAVINLIGAIVTLVLVPETKGKNIEQVEEALKGKYE